MKKVSPLFTALLAAVLMPSFNCAHAAPYVSQKKILSTRALNSLSYLLGGWEGTRVEDSKQNVHGFSLPEHIERRVGQLPGVDALMFGTIVRVNSVNIQSLGIIAYDSARTSLTFYTPGPEYFPLTDKVTFEAVPLKQPADQTVSWTMPDGNSTLTTTITVKGDAWEEVDERRSRGQVVSTYFTHLRRTGAVNWAFPQVEPDKVHPAE